MPVLSATTEFAGWVSVAPRPVSIKTNDLQANILANGYLNSYVQLVGQIFSNEQMALVETTDNGGTLGWYQISISGANTSLIVATSGGVILPVVNLHIATFDGTTGAIADQAGTAIQKGSIQAGLSGTAGTLISYPSAATNGSLIVAAVANVGNKTTTISSVAGLGQNEVVTIPDAGAATANFIISASGGTQHITSGALQVDAGVVSSGISTGGTAGGFIAYPATASNGSLRLTPVGNAGNFALSISNVSTQGQATVMTVPDVGAATGQFVVKTAAFVDGNLIKASGTAGITVDAGIASSNVQLIANLKANTTASYAGGGTSNAFTATGLTSSSIVVANILTSTNAVAVAKAVPSSNTLTITFTADPGAGTTVSWIALAAAQ